ncbi:MAG TPA: FAD-dependent oxidoreductase [Desulfobacterales bacterium]|nr:FAD-dependent oxidoreductase [Desulfobacterales bacterium]
MMSNKIYDVIIIGCGIMGCATADFLKRADDKLDVAVVEMDPTYSRAIGMHAAPVYAYISMMV